MRHHTRYLQIQCQKCSWTAVCSQQDMVPRLRDKKMLLRESDPEEELVCELFLASAATLRCDRCQAEGLTVQSVEEDEFDWDDARTCDVCGQAIPSERLDAIPDTRRCASCQSMSDRGQTEQATEHCPRCGAVMEMRLSRTGGITRYQLRCTECGH